MNTPTLKEIDAYEVPSFLAQRIAKLHNVPVDFAEGLIREAKRMLFLCIVSDASVAPSVRVDWAWHEMIMFTKFYKAYCEFLGAFIHHVPNPPDDEDEVEETWVDIQKTLGQPRKGSETYDLTKANYEKFFGMKPDPLFWP
jgi:hypothetical protein